MIDDIFAAVSGSLDCEPQLIVMQDPKLQNLKHIVVDYFVNDKGLCSGMIASHVQDIQSIDELELYVQQHYSLEDMLSIYKRAFING